MTVCLYVFPTLLAEVRRIHPHLDMKVTVGSAERSIAMLRSGAGDLGLLTLPIEAADLVSVPVLQEELLLVTYPTHPLAEAETNRARRSGQAAVRAVRDRIDHAPARRGVLRPRAHRRPTIIMETENVEIIKAMVRNGLGISIIPWQAAAADVQEQAAVLQPDRRRLAGASDRLALSEDEPAAAGGGGSDPGLRDGAAAARSGDAARRKM